MADQTNKHLEKKSEPAPKKCRGSKIVISFLFILLLAVSAVLCFGYFKLMNTHDALAQQLQQVEKQAENTMIQVSEIQQANESVTKMLEQSREMMDEQQNILKQWQAVQQGDLSHWQLIESRQLVSLANQAASQQDFNLAVALLDQAKRILEVKPNAIMLTILQAINKDLAKLQHMPTLNQQKLYLQLADLSVLTKQIPLKKPEVQQQVPEQQAVSGAWWQKAWQQTWHALRQIIVVKQLEQHDAPLILPQEQAFFHLNLQTKLENAMWAVLHHDMNVYQESMKTAIRWIEQYSDLDATATQAVLSQLKTLSRLNVSPVRIDIAPTLDLFNQNTASAN